MNHKIPNILVTLLTSSGIKYLKESVNSILGQKYTNFQYNLVIVVNTLNDSYYDLVKKTFPNIEIIRTESNGRPGKGHNSVINYFSDNSHYDYLIPIDGDDFLYPIALHQIEKYIHNYNNDVIFLMYTDQLTNTLNNVNIPHINILNKSYLLWNFNHITDKQWYIDKGPNPFENKIFTMNTPGRLILLSRKMIHYNLYYQEDCKLYDDYYLFMQILELMYSSDIKVIKTGDNNIYLYNKIITSSASYNFDLEDKESEEQAFRNLVNNSNFNNIRDWNLKKIPHQQIAESRHFNFNDKYIFLKKLVENLEIPHLKKKVDHKKSYEMFLREGYKISNISVIKTYTNLLKDL